MADRIDVLAVMDTLADGYLRNEGTEYAFVTCRTNTKPGDGTDVGDAWGRIRAARAAVAELIAADKEYDAAKARRIKANNRFTSGERSDDAYREQARANHAYDRAVDRRSVALQANCGEAT